LNQVSAQPWAWAGTAAAVRTASVRLNEIGEWDRAMAGIFLGEIRANWPAKNSSARHCDHLEIKITL
jgi:hypothetical protein